jgi:Methylase involved in ubiquinone/menaquinone biosynthesis
MSTSQSFDQAAESYDQTRPMLDIFATHGIPALLETMGPQARILDVGTGTGRISVPLLERGVDLVGCDLSTRMMARLLEKFPSARVVQSDAVCLPFPEAYFDVVLTVHVMHLVGAWREALREFKRLLKPGGIYLYVRTHESVGDSIRGEMRNFWHRWLAEQGIDYRPLGVQNREELLKELQLMKAQLSEVEAARFKQTYTLREELERFESQVYSDTWTVPDAIFKVSVEKLREWVLCEYRDLDQKHEEEGKFAFDIARFNA